ncbi:hypothetical protein AB0M87_06890 [Streptomyces sp. NPDC051320]|uniref:hypothetical protein n=1 Tax=Streptomyces sp. NPDC051320 TaxID=3154644 RepID=UPI00342C2224
MLLPLTCPKTELVEVVRITDPTRHITSDDLAGDTVAIWEGRQVRAVLELIAALPDSEPFRCFLPGWGIRAHGFTGRLFEIAFCFQCHTARIWGPDLPPERQGGSFDAESAPALELLRGFRTAMTD